MKKICFLVVLVLCIGVIGCKSLNKDPFLYKEPVATTDKISRIRFVGNVTGTSIEQKSDSNRVLKNLVPHTMFGFYNETRDIGIPKIAYRPQDYKKYYFEVKVKSEPTYIQIDTDSGINGMCMTGFIIHPEPGKDYDLNYDPNEDNKVCVFHFNEIVRDPSSGVMILKSASFNLYSKKNDDNF